MYHAYHITTGEVARDADLYYEALLRAGKYRSQRLKRRGKGVIVELPEVEEIRITEARKQFTYAFKPDYMFQVLNQPSQMIRQMKILYGASQMDN